MAATGKHPPSPLPPNLAATQLLLDLFDGQPHALTSPFEQWVMTSKPFTAFAQTYLSKIRKKVRMSRDAEESYNLYCELRTAYLLLQEPKFVVAYEPGGLRAGRSADFAVTFRTRTTFHVEVTRLRISQPEQQLSQQEGADIDTLQILDLQHIDESGLHDQLDFIRRYESRRLVDVVCEKFGQLSPETPNVLWMWSESRVMPELDVGQVMVGLKRRVEQRDPDLFSRYGFAKPADFIRYFQRLSAILVQNLHEKGADSSLLLWQNLLWQNKDSRHPLPAKVANLLPALIIADHSQPFSMMGNLTKPP